MMKLFMQIMYWLKWGVGVVIAGLIGLILWLVVGCSMLSPNRQMTPTVQAAGSNVHQTTNDPTSINVLAYALGASVLIGSLSQSWYNRARVRHAKANGR